MKFYGYKKCSTCRNAEKKLEAMGIAFSFIDITENPPSKSELETIISQSGKDLKKFFNTSGVQYKELGMKDKLPTMTPAQVMSTLVGNGRLLKRPLVTDGKRSTVGFEEGEFVKTWKK